jgi:hypothetical protein
MLSAKHAGSRVFEVANLRLNGQDWFTLIQAEEIICWAVTDLPHRGAAERPTGG